jgi:hypothetical protein
MSRIPSGLSARLGPDASKGLDELLDAERRDWSEQVLSVSAERFERRLVDETSKLRIDIAALGAGLRQEIAKDRFDLLRWMLLCWVSQLAAMSAIMSFLLRT